MLHLYRNEDSQLKEVEDFKPGTWVRMLAPTEDEIAHVSQECSVEPRHLEAALDIYEMSRAEASDSSLCLVASAPYADPDDIEMPYSTQPISIVVTRDYVITSGIYGLPAFTELIKEEKTDLDPTERVAFVCRVLLMSAELYQRYLRAIDDERRRMIEGLGSRTSNRDLIRLHGLETALVYFETGLRENKLAFELIGDYERVQDDKANSRLIKDVMLETKQSIEMCSIYRSLVSSTRELFSSALDNTLNTVMKILTSLTIILAVPTIISGFYGMNVAADWVPLSNTPWGFGIILLITLALCAIIAVWLHKKDLL